MIQFNAKANIVISDDLASDIILLLNEENVKKVALIVDTNISEIESILNLKSSLDKNYNLLYKQIQITEPTTDMVNQHASELKQNLPDIIIGIGGGSTMDLVKAISVMSVNEGIVEDYHGTGKQFTRGIRKILVPSTAGSGAEVTKGAVLINKNTNFKRAIGGKHVTADYALLNAELTSSMPDSLTAATGMDALAHSIESYTTKCGNEITRMYALKAFSLIYNNLSKVFNDKNNLTYRKNILLGSCLAGFAIYNSDTGACHALSYPLGIYNNVPHGIAVATLLPKVVEININKGAYQYADLYDLINGKKDINNKKEKAVAFLECLSSFEAYRYISKTFKDYGINETNMSFLAERGMDLKGAIDNNPVEFTLEDSLMVFKKSI